MVDEYDYMPKGSDRIIDSSRETSSDGGGYSFAYNGSLQKQKQKKKKKRDVGNPVDVKLSSILESQSDNLKQQNNPEEAKKDKEQGGKGIGRINLKA